MRTITNMEAQIGKYDEDNLVRIASKSKNPHVVIMIDKCHPWFYEKYALLFEDHVEFLNGINIKSILRKSRSKCTS